MKQEQQPQPQPQQPGESMVLTTVIHPVLSKLAENAKDKAAIEALKKQFDATEKANPTFAHNFLSEILDLVKSKK